MSYCSDPRWLNISHPRQLKGLNHFGKISKNNFLHKIYLPLEFHLINLFLTYCVQNVSFVLLFKNVIFNVCVQVCIDKKIKWQSMYECLCWYWNMCMVFRTEHICLLDRLPWATGLDESLILNVRRDNWPIYK